MQIQFSDIKLISKLISSEDLNWHIEDQYNEITWDDNPIYDSKKEDISVTLNGVSCLKQESAYVIAFGKKVEKLEGYQHLTYHYICNQDGSIRWIYPNSLSKPTFLNFYNASTPKAKLAKHALQISHTLKLNRWANHGSFHVFYKSEILLHKLLEQTSYTGYSIFTGTVGPNRKAIIELNTNGETTHFIKVGLNKNSKDLIRNEAHILVGLQQVDLGDSVIPNATLNCDLNSALFNNIKPQNAIQGSSLKNEHFSFLENLYAKTTNTIKLEQAYSFFKIKSELALATRQPHFYRVESIYESLETLLQSIPQEVFVPVGLAHGDFTPWNTFSSENKLSVFDWELATFEMPLLFDAFHFVFQSAVMLKNAGWKQIKLELSFLLRNEKLQAIVDKYSIDVHLHFKLYLLSNIGYYLNIYAQQESLHPQGYRLLSVWSCALRGLLNEQKSYKNKPVFITDFKNKISVFNYVLLKNHPHKKEELYQDADIDLLIEPKNLTAITSFIKNHHTVSKVSIHKKSFMTTVELYFKDHTFLSVDLLTQFKRKELFFLSSDLLLQSSFVGESGFKQALVSFDLEYTWLFYLLNNSNIPTKYQLACRVLKPAEQISIRKYFNSKYNIELSTLADCFHFNPELKNQVIEIIKNRHENRGVNKLKSKFNYCVDTIKQRKGMVLTINGVDGAGKSTIIEQLKEKLSKKYRKPVVVLRHRPSLLPILSAWRYGAKRAEEISVSRLPHAGTNTNVASSFIRFGYYYIDYLIGQFYVFLKYVLRGKIVIYDRYYYDFINDPKRSNIIIPKWLTKSLFRCLLKPKINIFLYADADEIHRRKQEVSKERIRKMNQDYLDLFHSFSDRYKNSTYLPIENINRQETLDTILYTYAKLA
jgi:thymidylate kinase